MEQWDVTPRLSRCWVCDRVAGREGRQWQLSERGLQQQRGDVIHGWH